MPRKASGTSPKPELSPYEQRIQWAEAGDFERLYRLLCENSWSMIPVETVGRQLLRALEVRAQADPGAFADTILSQMLSFTTFLTFRSQHFATVLIRQADQVAGSHGHRDFSIQLVDMLPRIIQLQNHVADLALAQAQCARLRQLARQQPDKRRLTDHEMSPETRGIPRSARPQKQPISRGIKSEASPARTENGHYSQNSHVACIDGAAGHE